jgi:carboxypeptidase D
MHASREFKGGITNGAKWYPLWGGMQDWHYIATGTMSVTIEVNDLKFPKASELGRLWREHRGGIFAAATVATRGALRGFVLDATTTEPIKNAALTVKGVDFPFAPNALGFFARPVSGQRDPVGGDDAATTPFLVTVTATAPGYVADEKTVTVDPLDGVDLVFEMVRVEINGLGGGAADAAAADAAADRLRAGETTSRRFGGGKVAPRRIEPGTASTVSPGRPHPEAVWGGAAFVVLAAAATIRRRRARAARGRGVSRVEGV